MNHGDLDEEGLPKWLSHREVEIYKKIWVGLELHALRLEVEDFFKTQKGAAKRAVCAVLLSKIKKREQKFRKIG